jgi:hypothetical protein
MKTLLLAMILGAMTLHAQIDPLEGLWLIFYSWRRELAATC